MNPLKNQRIGWIDYTKSIAIFFVILIHTHCNDAVTVTLKSFTMPIFFFVSGFLFSRERNPDYGAFAVKRFRQLVVPYIWINAVAYVAWLLVLRHYGADSDAGPAWHEPLIAATLGLPSGLSHDIPLWSLLCFFVVEMVYYPLQRSLIKNDAAIALIFFIVASVVALLRPQGPPELPLSLTPSLTAMIFYALGHLASVNRQKLEGMWRPNLVLLLTGVLMVAAGVTFNTPVSFFIGKTGNPIFFIIGTTGGILSMIQISVILSSIKKDPGIIRFISRGTLIICGFHLLALAGIKGILMFGFGIDPSILTVGLLRGIAMSIGALVLCMPIIWFIERYARFLVSK